MGLLDQDDDTGMWMIFGGLFLIIASFIGDFILLVFGGSDENKREVKRKGTLELSGDDTIDGKNAARYFINKLAEQPQFYNQMLTIYKDNSTSTYKLRILSYNYLTGFWSELSEDLQEFILGQYDAHPKWSEYNLQ